MIQKAYFPFSAIVGQEKVKKALFLNMINPKIGGILVSGDKGTAKSTMIRGFANILPEKKVIELPLNITEDRLIGSIKIERVLRDGRRDFTPGILHQADNNVLYIDEINLLSDQIINNLLDVAQSGISYVEREGLSFSYQTNFLLIGTMNPEEGLIRSQLLDRFGLFVEIKGEKELAKRTLLIKRRLEYEKNPIGFYQRFVESELILKEKIVRSRIFLKKVVITNYLIKLVVELVRENNCQGHRADLIMIETAKAIAAFNERKHIQIQDLIEAAKLVLPHRSTIKPPVFSENPQDQKTNHQKTSNEQQNQSVGNNISEQKNETDFDGLTKNCLPQEEKVVEIGDLYQVKSIEFIPLIRKKRKGSGKRSKSRTSAYQGKYIRSCQPIDQVKDLAFDATLRAAAVNQLSRKTKELAIIIEKSDLREKIREKKIGNTLLFVVDASGSMGANQRMQATKAAVFSLLNDAYQRRDEVGLVAFRKDKAECLLEITRSPELAYRSLQKLPTGGKTPLAAGLLSGFNLLRAKMVKDPEVVPVLILISDCRPNVSIKGKNPVLEAKEICHKIRSAGINSLLIDTEDGFWQLGLAKELVEIMKGKYLKLKDLKAAEIKFAVKNYLGVS